MDLVRKVSGTAHRASLEARSLAALVRAGAVGFDSPRKTWQVVRALREYGPFGAAPRVAAIRHGGRTAIRDDRGVLAFDELDERVNRLAGAFRVRGYGPGTRLAILCRNHRGPLLAAFAASRLGMTTVWLNTGFSPRQAGEVTEREGADVLVYDADLAEAADGVKVARARYACQFGLEGPDEFDALLAEGTATAPPPPAKPGRVVLLTSGTTGTPKGAPRAEPKSLSTAGALLERMPLRARETTLIGPPLFHGTGLTTSLLSIALGSEIVLRRSFDAAQFLADSEATDATAWCVVPVMLQRMLALGEDVIRQHDLSAVRVVFCAGSQLSADVSGKVTALLGNVIYNLYGSTECSVATLATPEDVRAAPSSVGKPALGSRVKLLDDHGKEVPRGRTGRIFVGSTLPFDGYTGGGNKETVAGLIATGDVGHFDEAGRLHVDGRDDDMIVSGGENVFPQEIEELLVSHPAIADAAAVGVPDAEFGERLRAFVVLRPGHRLAAEAVRAYVKDNLARYKVPREVVFLEDLPRTATGKIIKRELAAPPG